VSIRRCNGTEVVDRSHHPARCARIEKRRKPHPTQIATASSLTAGGKACIITGGPSAGARAGREMT